jgi:hypothetical protein
MNGKPLESFRFFSRFTLTMATGRQAATLQELRNGLAELPDTVVYQHTHRFMAEHQSLVPEPSNDFALWVEEALQDEALGERLAAVDTLRFSSLEDLRRELLRVIDEALPKAHDRRAPAGQEFHFMSAVRFSVPTGLEARDLAGFAEALKRAGPSSLFLHLYEAPLRPPWGVNDFSYWFAQALGEKDLAKAVSDLDLYRHTLEEVKRQILELVKVRLEFDSAMKETHHAAT